MKITILLAFAVVTVLASDVTAQQIGDAKQGFKYAQQACSECHWVAGENFVSPDPLAPSFNDIANTPGMNERALLVWFRTPHPTMPNFILETQDEEDVIAYIVSLKKKK